MCKGCVREFNHIHDHKKQSEEVRRLDTIVKRNEAQLTEANGEYQTALASLENLKGQLQKRKAAEAARKEKTETIEKPSTNMTAADHTKPIEPEQVGLASLSKIVLNVDAPNDKDESRVPEKSRRRLIKRKDDKLYAEMAAVRAVFNRVRRRRADQTSAILDLIDNSL